MKTVKTEKKKTSYLKGTYTHRRTETDYMAVLLEAVTLEDWRCVVTTAVSAAKNGDTSARAWLGQYLVGKPDARAPAPLTVVAQQLSGNSPLVKKLAEPYISREEFPVLFDGDSLKEEIELSIVAELEALEGPESDPPENKGG